MSKQLKIFKYYENLLNKRHGEENLKARDIQDEDSCVFVYDTKSKYSDLTHYRAELYRETDDAYHVHFKEISLFKNDDPTDYEGVGDTVSFEELDKEMIDSIEL